MVMKVVTPRNSINTVFERVGVYGFGGSSGCSQKRCRHEIQDEEAGTVEMVQIGGERTKNVLILMSDTGGGHRASAEAIRDAFRLEYGDEYRVITNSFPVLFFRWILFPLANATTTLKHYSRQIVSRAIRYELAHIHRAAPNLIVFVFLVKSCVARLFETTMVCVDVLEARFPMIFLMKLLTLELFVISHCFGLNLPAIWKIICPVVRIGAWGWVSGYWTQSISYYVFWDLFSKQVFWVSIEFPKF